MKHQHLANMSLKGDIGAHFDHADSWHGKIEEGGDFPPEKGRYHMYIGIDMAVPATDCFHRLTNMHC